MIAHRLEALVTEMVERGVQFPDAAREFEKRFIARVLAAHEGSLTKAAAALGLHRNTLARKVAEHGLTRRD